MTVGLAPKIIDQGIQFPLPSPPLMDPQPEVAFASLFDGKWSVYRALDPGRFCNPIL